MSTSDQDKEELEELYSLYPQGSKERQVLEYSMAHHEEGEVPELLVSAFKVLMGITIVMVIFSLAAYLSY